MSLLDKNLAGDILDEALSTGGDFAEVFVEKTQGEDIFLSERQVKKISSGMHYGVGIRVFLGTFQTYAHTNILTRDNLLAAARNAARGIKGQAAAKAADLAPVAIADQNPVLIYPRDVDKRDKIVLLQEVSELVYAQSPLIEQVAANIKEEAREILIANSDGVWAEDRQVRSRFNLSAMALRDGIKEQSRRGFAKMCGYELFDSFPGGREAFAADVAERAVARTYAANAPSGKMPVIIANGFGGTIFHEACGHSLEAIAISRGTSEFCGKIGQTVASELVTAFDDAGHPGLWGSINIDDEGMPAGRRLLIENGVLKGYLIDKFYGRKLGLESNGAGRRQDYTYMPAPRMSNTYIAAGKSEPEEIIAATAYGLYAKELSGGSVNTTTGEFNFAVDEAYLVRDGKIAEQVKGARLIGKGIEVLKKIDMMGSDLAFKEGTCGASSGHIPVTVGQPTIRVSEITVGGQK